MRSKKNKRMRSKKNKRMSSKKNKSLGGAGLFQKNKLEERGDKLCKSLSSNEFFKKCKIIVIVGHGSLLDEKLKIDKNKIIIPLNRKKKWIDPYKTGPESMVKFKLLREEIKKILQNQGDGEEGEILKRVQEKLNEIMQEKVKKIENEAEDLRFGEILMEMTGEETVEAAELVATDELLEEVNQRLILEHSMPLVNSGYVNENGIVIKFTVYDEPKDMEIVLLGGDGDASQKKKKEKKYADTNYILGFTKDGKSDTIQTIEDTKIKISTLLEVLNKGDEVEEEKIIIPIICLVEKSTGIVTLVDGVNSMFAGTDAFEDGGDLGTPRSVYNARLRVQPGEAEKQMGFSPSPLKLRGEDEKTPVKKGLDRSKSLSSPFKLLTQEENNLVLHKSKSAVSVTTSSGASGSSLGSRKRPRSNSNVSSKTNDGEDRDNVPTPPGLKLIFNN